MIGTPKDINERRDLVMNLFGVYALFRKIYPSEEERKTYKLFWALQKKIPVVEGHCHILIYLFKYLNEVIFNILLLIMKILKYLKNKLIFIYY